MKSKTQTNSEILEGASESNNEVSLIKVRHVDSQHPKDCSCDLCKPLRFQSNSSPAELKKKTELDWLRT